MDLFIINFTTGFILPTHHWSWFHLFINQLPTSPCKAKPPPSTILNSMSSNGTRSGLTWELSRVYQNLNLGLASGSQLSVYYGFRIVLSLTWIIIVAVVGRSSKILISKRSNHQPYQTPLQPCLVFIQYGYSSRMQSGRSSPPTW